MRFAQRILVTTCLSLLACAMNVGAQGIVRPADRLDQPPRKMFAWLPYAFYTNTFEFAVGAGAASFGHGQPQLGLTGAALVSTNASYGIFGKATNFQIRPIDRLFLDATVGFLRYTGLTSYIPGNPDFPDERAGSNDSSAENFIVTPARDGFANLELRYLLPLGAGRDTIVNTFVIEDGILKSGATGGWAWNPTKSGRSFVGLELFYRAQNLQDDTGERPFDASGLAMSLEHDNTDFRLNPSRGSRKIVTVQRDFGWFDSSDDWTTIEGEFAKFINLGAGKRTRQRVLALNLWTIDTPTWNDTASDDGSPAVEGAPPYYQGASLGGLYRMRGFSQYRFHDKAAIYYSAELRFIPKRSPLSRIDHVGEIEFNWWQFVVFAELGRVSPTWSLSELHRDMKWDVGVGIRTLIRRTVLRLDVGLSTEGASLWVMAGQTF